jgi:hypothetical protein
VGTGACNARGRFPAGAHRGLRSGPRPSGHRAQKAVGGYSLFSAHTGGPIARLRPTGDGDKVQVLWWNGQRWGAAGPFGIATMPLDQALDYVASEPAFWIHA